MPIPTLDPCSAMLVQNDGNHAGWETTDKAQLDLTGDMVFEGRVTLFGSPSAGAYLLSKMRPSGSNYSFAFIVAPGYVYFQYSTNGSTISSVNVFPATDDIPTDEYVWIRITHLRNDGGVRRVTVEVSSDDTDDPDAVTNSTWGTSTVANVAAIDVGVAPVTIGHQRPGVISSTGILFKVVRLTDDPLGTPTVVAYPRFADASPDDVLIDDGLGNDWVVDTFGYGEPIIDCLVPYDVVDLAAAESGSVAYGPLDVYTEDTIHDPIEVAVLDYATLGRETELPDSYGREFQEPLAEPGVGSFSLMNDDTGLTAITAEVLVGLFLYGQHAMTIRPEMIETGFIGPEEEFDENSRITGRQHLVLFDEAVVYPARGSDSEPVWDDRSFNWTSPRPDFDDSLWKNAKELGMQNSIDVYAGTPENWPLSGGFARWISPPQGTVLDAPPGICYYRSPDDYKIPTGVNEIAIFFSCDDPGEFYFDGNLVFENDNGHYSMVSGFFDVTPGLDVQFAARVRNIPRIGSLSNPIQEANPRVHIVTTGETLWELAARFYGAGVQWRTIYNANASIIKSTAIARGRWWPNDPGRWIFPGTPLIIPGFSATSNAAPKPNPTSLLVSVFPSISGEISSNIPIFSTTDAWLCVPYPPEPPGMTVGRVIRILLLEAQRRGALEGLTLDFTDKVDSNGAAWPQVTDISTKVGTDYLTLLVKELAETYADFWMHPSDKRLSAWVKGTRGSTMSNVLFHGPTDPNDPDSSNLAQQSIIRSL